MRLPSTEARAFVFGPPELAELLAGQFAALGIRAETARTPLTEEELYSWLTAHASDQSTFVHPGLSFWADRPEFPQIAGSLGFFPVTPSARTLSLCLNKLNLFFELEAAGVPHLAISLDPLTSLREIEEALAKSGEAFPIVLKSLKVAQGHGIQVIQSAKELRETVPTWFEQLSRRYGEASVLIERSPASARHLVVPFAADGDRFLQVYPAIDASLQTRWRRMMQFVPASDLDPAASVAIREAVEKWTRHLGFSGFGSMEFLVDGSRIYAIDAIARLNAAFPLLDELLGTRTLEWQLAGLGQLPAPKALDPGSAPYGAGVALRLYSEDPIREVPCPGLIRDITPPSRWREGDASVMWMTRYVSGQRVAWTSSGVIGELFVLGKDRPTTLAAAAAALRRTWIAGEVQTNRRFLLEHLEHPFVRENLIHAGFTDEDFVPEGFPGAEVVAAAVSVAATLFPGDGARWAAGGKWVEPDLSVPPTLEGVERFREGDLEGALGTVRFGKGEAVRFHFEPGRDDRWLVAFGTWTLTVRRILPGVAAAKPESAGRTRRILALAPGRVHALLRQAGETLQPRDRACMIESIGILVPHAVPVEARLLEWKVSPGDIVEAGRELAVFELLG